MAEDTKPPKKVTTEHSTDRLYKDLGGREPNVYEKIFNVQQGIHAIIKGGFNEHFKYSFARERDVIAEVKPLLGKEGLVITNSLLKEEEIEHGTTSSGGKKFLAKLTFRFRITNIKDKEDFVEGDAIGYGQDGEDKGAPKAYTMALKYFLSKQFLIETGDDAEDDKGRKGKAGEEPSGAKFEKAKRMIKESRNVDGLMEYGQKLGEKGSSFNATQKVELQKLLKERVDELTGG